MIYLLMLTGDDVPAVVRARPDFSGAIGQGIVASGKWSNDSPSLQDSLILTLTITKVTNPTAVIRPMLTQIPAWQQAFQIEDDSVQIDSNRVQFTYRCRPRSPGLITLPRLKFVSFNPSGSDGRQVQTTYAEIPSITISDEPTPRIAIPLPDRFIGRITYSNSWMGQWGWLVMIPLSLAGLVGMIRIQNDRSVRIRRRQIESARRELRLVRESTDPAASILIILEREQIDLHKIRKLSEAIRFAPNPAAIDDLILQAERMLPSC